MKTRTEHDSMGELQVPAEALYQAQTQRAVQNFQLSGQTLPADFIRALLHIKKAAAAANLQLGLLAADISQAICQAADAQLAAGAGPLEQVTGLAVEHPAHGFQGAEAHGLGPAVLQHRHVRGGEPDAIGELPHAHPALGQLDVDAHDARDLGQVVALPKLGFDERDAAAGASARSDLLLARPGGGRRQYEPVQRAGRDR